MVKILLGREEVNPGKLDNYGIVLEAINVYQNFNTNDPMNRARFVLKKPLPCRPDQALEANVFHPVMGHPPVMGHLNIFSS